MKDTILVKPFKYKNFRLLILSEMIYRSPIWMTALVFSLMMKDLYPGSTFYQGLLGFLYGIPMLLLTPFSGVLADRFKRLNILKVMQLAFSIPLIVMVISLLMGSRNFTVIAFSTLFTGISFAINVPALQAFVANTITDKKDIGAGVSVFNSFNRAWQFLGYGIGGMLYAAFGAVFCFIFAFVSNIMSLLLLFKIDIKEKKNEVKRKPLEELKFGLKYIHSHFNVKMIIVLIAMNGFFVFSYIFQMTIVNADYLHGTDRTLGFLLSIGGLGALCAGLVINLRKSTLYLTYVIRGAILLIVISYIVLSFLRSVLPAYPTIFVLDFGLSLLIISSATFIQQVCPEEIRGRVMGVFTMANIGMIPLGNLLYYGLLGEVFGPMHMFQISSVMMLVLFVYFCLRLPKLRAASVDRYIENGLLKSADEINKI